MYKVTHDEFTALFEAIANGMHLNNRFSSFVSSLRISGETNKLYNDISDVQSELWEAYDFLRSNVDIDWSVSAS